jgi:hypothetical protein
VTAHRRIVVEIERVVVDNVTMQPGDVAVARAAIVQGLTEWLTGLDTTTLTSAATPRTSMPLPVVRTSGPARSVGAGISRAIQSAIAPPPGEPR